MSSLVSTFRYLLLLACLGLSTAVLGEEVGQVTKLVGRADVVRNGQAAQPLSLKAGLLKSDILRTKAGSLLEITLRDGSRITMSENTRLAIKTYLSDEPRGLFDVMRGRVRAFVTDVFSRRSESFQIRTPTAIAGVMGTEFVVIVTPRQSKIIVNKGLVVVANRDPTIIERQVLKPRQMSIVRLGEPPMTPVPIENWLEEWGGNGGAAGTGASSTPGASSTGTEDQEEGLPLGKTESPTSPEVILLEPVPVLPTSEPDEPTAPEPVPPEPVPPEPVPPEPVPPEPVPPEPVPPEPVPPEPVPPEPVPPEPVPPELVPPEHAPPVNAPPEFEPGVESPVDSLFEDLQDESAGDGPGKRPFDVPPGKSK